MMFASSMSKGIIRFDTDKRSINLTRTQCNELEEWAYEYAARRRGK